MKIRPNRRMEREAVNATKAFFESCDCVCQEVDLANDYGKDLYVDITDSGKLTGICVALQVKGGVSFRRSNGYAIPLDPQHASVWRRSNIPIAGVVYDPDDRLLRWCNISEFLQSTSDSTPSHIPVEASAILTAESLESGFKVAYRTYDVARTVGRALLQLPDRDANAQCQALRDCFVLGRCDPRVLIMIRCLLSRFHDDVLRLAVMVLTHATPHPDILFTKHNWIPPETEEVIRTHFVWSVEEVAILLNSASPDEWHRGGQGQHIYSLLCVDSDIEKKIGEVAISALQRGDEELAFRAMYLAIYWARSEGQAMFEGFLAIDRGFGRLPLSSELALILREHGRITLFE